MRGSMRLLSCKRLVWCVAVDARIDALVLQSMLMFNAMVQSMQVSMRLMYDGSEEAC
jgi:hypothetical protein